MIKKEVLENLYFDERLSMVEIADKLGCGDWKVRYWMNRHEVPRRSWSEATYVKRNPDGDPFQIKKNLSSEEEKLFHLTLGLYWGEGHKKAKHVVEIGNTDPKMILVFTLFLKKICGVEEKKIKYYLQVFNDSDPDKAVSFWSEELGLEKEKIGKPSIIASMGKGSYKEKNMNGVLTASVHNVKLKKIMDGWLRDIRNCRLPG